MLFPTRRALFLIKMSKENKVSGFFFSFFSFFLFARLINCSSIALNSFFRFFS